MLNQSQINTVAAIAALARQQALAKAIGNATTVQALQAQMRKLAINLK